jgi:hypothetical protein
MKPMIFGVGLNKTGTTSICRALELLGWAPRHNSEANELSARSWRWPGGVNAFLDGPLHRHQWRLAEGFRDAMFIQTIRPQDDWINSRVIHVLHNRLRNDGDPWTEIDTASWAREWQDWRTEAERFRARYRRRVLLWDVTDAPHWGPICDFLNLPAPDVPFPHENSGTWRLESILRLLRQRAGD